MSRLATFLIGKRMQGLIEDGIRAAGWVTLFVVTLGRYKTPQNDALLLEGGVGLAVVAAVTYAVIIIA